MNKYILFLGLFMCLLGCKEVTSEPKQVPKLPYFNEATFTPQWLSEEEVPANFHQIPAFSLTDQEGERVTEKDLDGKVTVVDFFFTACPGICSDLTNNLGLVQEPFLNEDKVIILSHSVTPEQDNVAILKSYAKVRGVNSNRWHLLTGDRSVIYDLGRNQYFIEEDLGLEQDEDAFIHTENLVLIDQKRRIRGIYNGLNKSSVNRLIDDMNVLLEGE